MAIVFFFAIEYFHQGSTTLKIQEIPSDGNVIIILATDGAHIFRTYKGEITPITEGDSIAKNDNDNYSFLLKHVEWYTNYIILFSWDVKIA